ncbi:DDE-type integrase/transposase/recombinase [Vibrio parahaemolyticus]|nr:DDE-type integrase/transposase/recombinase [Vibrio parahaemolyticus]EGR1757302.1 hypothetical protein [Vibrio parahaemolyticus]ELB2094464.1 DDE-type integrase/transposase/recombinase [Vibrio parahaemolyticus]ELB2126775.1 DDE-type integrase/transposase/recombinase [Vibrio parahaemolyticus]MBX5339193.1 DDE-type integrase/transposase/recombinase [Vibrio parahaemolyticus]MCX8804416.1 DDE-type integrase/transposase/recombinase [Vibrio parahaemolyticus]
MGYGHHIYLGEEPLALLGDSNGLAFKTHCGLVARATMTVELITNALKMAFESRKPPKGVIIHSDRGVKYQDFMRNHGGVPSMSRQGNCWDNAVMESFYSRLKVELIYAEDYQTSKKPEWASSNTSRYFTIAEEDTQR